MIITLNVCPLSVGAFATLLFFPLCTLRSTQDVEVRQKKEDDQPQTPSQGPGWPTKRSHTRAKTTSSFGNDVHRSLIMLRGKGRENKSDFQKLGHPSDQRPSLSFMASEEAVLQVFRSYSDSEYDSVTINELSSAACKKPFGQSFTGADTRARYNIQAEWARSQYFVWWLAALATMLCGIIVGSLNQTRVLVLLYFPVSVVFFVLVGQRLSSPPRYNLILHIQDDLTSPGSEKKQDLEPTSTAPRPRPPPFARSLSYHSSPDWHDVKGQTLTSETDCRPTSAFKHERSKLSRGFTNIQMLHPQGQQQDERGLRTRIISFVRRGSSIPILSRTKERLEDMRPSRQANWDSHDGTHPTKDSLYSVRTSGISGDAVIEVDMLKSGNGTLSKARSSRSASETLSNRHKSNYSRNDTSDSDASAATAVQQDTHSATYRAASFFDNRARSERTTVDQEPTLQEPPLPNAVFTALRPRRRPSCTSQRSALRHTSCEPTDDALRLEVTREVPEEKIGAGQAMKSVNAGTCERQVQGSSVHSMSAHICGSHTMQRPPSLSATDMQGTSTVDSFGIVKPRRVPAASQNADDAMYNPISQSALHVGDKSDSSTSCEGECGTRAIDVKDDGVANNTPKQAKQENFDGALDQGSEPERALTTREIIEMERNRRQAFQAGLLFKPVETSSSSPSRVHHDTKANKTAAFLDRPLTSSPATLTHPLKGSPGKITLEHEKEKLRAVPAIGKTTAQAQPQRRRSMSLDHQGDENLASQVVKAETKKGLKLLEEFLCQEQSLAHTPNGIQAVEADSEPAKDALTRSGEDKDSANNLIQLARSRSRRRMEKTTRQDVIFF